MYWRGSEASIPVSWSLFAPPPLPTVARAPSRGLPNPWGQPATLQRSAKADLVSSLPNTQAPVVFKSKL